MPQYFRNFPTIIYNGREVRDITRVAKIENTDTASPYVFYPYTITHWLRSDNIAEYYYDDPYNDWLVYLSNKIIDPYYQWYLTNDALHSLIVEKYGSIEIAQRKVKYYQNNWSDDDIQITPSFYNNNLPDLHKKYYNPVFSSNQKIISYKRKEDDVVTNTNRILQYTIASNNANIAFTAGELVNVRATGQDATIGKGEIAFSNSTVIQLQSVSGETHANSTVQKDLLGTVSGANCTVNAVSIHMENFSNNEAIFWSEVTYYDWEVLQNELKKDINLVSDALAPLLVNEFRQKISEDADSE